ncbi:MAG: hypothetical protein LBU92_03195, partial [Prevotellaceae bacterium]|nr:hypothetical protein [Prevotellaceae bacterium]
MKHLNDEIAGQARNDSVKLRQTQHDNRQAHRHCEERGTSDEAISRQWFEIGSAELRFATVASLNPLAMTWSIDRLS